MREVADRRMSSRKHTGDHAAGQAHSNTMPHAGTFTRHYYMQWPSKTSRHWQASADMCRDRGAACL